MPIEGGLYQWAKLGFNEFTGFLVAWNLWAYKLSIAATGFVILSLLALISIRGLAIGKWVHNAGGVLMVVIFLA